MSGIRFPPSLPTNEVADDGGSTSWLPATGSPRSLAPGEFERLRHVPPLIEWLANVENPNTRRAYRSDLAEFMAFAGLPDSDAFRTVSRAHVIAWRRSMTQRALKPASVRRKLSALSEFFDFLTDLKELVDHAPVDAHLDLDHHTVALERPGLLLAPYEGLAPLEQAFTG